VNVIRDAVMGAETKRPVPMASVAVASVFAAAVKLPSTVTWTFEP
jgi:hypothetical protein